jgi:hypothetical protein
VNAFIGYQQRQLPYWKRLKSKAIYAKIEYRGECLIWVMMVIMNIVYTIIFASITATVAKITEIEIGPLILGALLFGIFFGSVTAAEIYKKFYSAKIEEEIKVYEAKIIDWKQQKINSEKYASYFPIYEIKLDDGKTYFIKGLGRYEKKSESKNMVETIGIGKTTNRIFFEWEYYIEDRVVWQIIWEEFINVDDE